ncbi:QacE family quaternary ammonium compound efflux SMR transporter [Butyricicoccus sp. 1XD8-22]|nr:QacE family quaternary ammonium compound efflux SMR transporter [Butyricicoccus sp. 1XD8-22]
MNKHWIKILLAALFEVLWIIGLAHSDNLWSWIGTIIAIIICNYFLLSANQVLPTGTAYTVFVGLGTAGAVISEILFFGEPINLVKIAFIFLLLIGVVGLKLQTDKEEKEEANV